MDDAPFMIFECKEEQLEELTIVDEEKRVTNVRFAATTATHVRAGIPQKTIMILGFSRLLYFNHVEYARNHPDWEQFNFSVPVTCPIY